MTTVSYNAAAQCFFAFDVTIEDALTLSKLLWHPHPDANNTWWSRSPYLAAPLWHCVNPQDAGTRDALSWYAWNYQTSFSKFPLVGTGIDSIRIPAGEKPFPFQVAGVQRACMRNRILLAEEPGLGKSCEALVTANMTRPRRIVIGCPPGIVHNWAAECEKWLVDPRSITILNNPRKAFPDEGVLILPYSHGHNFRDRLLSGPATELMILDEIHWCKNPAARRTAPWLGHGGLAERATRVIALTGTPIPNNPLEIHALMRVLAPDTVGHL